MIFTEITIDVIEMIKFKGLSISLMHNLFVDGGNGSVINQITFPPSLFEDALSEKLASGAWSVCNYSILWMKELTSMTDQ